MESSLEFAPLVASRNVAGRAREVRRLDAELTPGGLRSSFPRYRPASYPLPRAHPAGLCDVARGQGSFP